MIKIRAFFQYNVVCLVESWKTPAWVIT